MREATVYTTVSLDEVAYLNRRGISPLSSDLDTVYGVIYEKTPELFTALADFYLQDKYEAEYKEPLSCISAQGKDV